MKKLMTSLATILIALPALAVQPGDKAPDFELSDTTGKVVHLSDFEGTIRVLEWTNPECPFVRRHYQAGTMKKLEAKYRDRGVVWLTINSSHHEDRDFNAAFASKNELTVPLLVDQSGEVGRAYGAKTTPHMFVVDQKGTVVYAGAIDDDPRGRNESPHNYVDAALTALLDGKPIVDAETAPYGCSVKYGK